MLDSTLNAQITSEMGYNFSKFVGTNQVSTSADAHVNHTARHRAKIFPSRAGVSRTSHLQLEVVGIGSAGREQHPRAGAGLRVGVAVVAGAEHAHEVLGEGDQIVHPPPLARVRRHRTGRPRADRNPSPYSRLRTRRR